jgi:hypothetical protein
MLEFAVMILKFLSRKKQKIRKEPETGQMDKGVPCGKHPFA